MRAWIEAGVSSLAARKGAYRFPSLETRNHHQRALSEARRGATEQEKVRPASMNSTLVVF